MRTEIEHQPLELSPLHEQVHQRLRDALMGGHFKPGEPLTLRGIAQQFGVGVMPVRSAVRQLVNCGALEMPNSRSTRIPSVSTKRFREMHTMRRLLEGEAAAEAAIHVSDAQLVVIENLQNTLENSVNPADFESVLQVNRDFHFAVYRAADNAVLMGFIEDLWLQNGPYLALVADEDELAHESYFGHHKALIEALRQHRPDRARAALIADLDDAIVYYEARLAALEDEDKRKAGGARAIESAQTA